MVSSLYFTSSWAFTQLTYPDLALGIFVNLTFGIFAMLSILMWRGAQVNTEVIAKELGVISEILGDNAQLEPYETAYLRLAEWAKTAKKEILILTTTGNNRWTLNSNNNRMASSEREVWFRSLEKAILSEDIVVQRIIQSEIDVDACDATSEKLEKGYQYLNKDELNRSSSRLFCEVGENNPSSARLMFSRAYFSNTFVLVDEKYLFLNIDVYNPKTKQLESPFVLIAEDKSGKRFQALRKSYMDIIPRSRTIYDKSRFIKETENKLLSH